VPELPDVVVYCERLAALAVGEPLDRLRVAKPWVLRSVDPPVSALSNRTLTGVSRLGKRIVLGFTDDIFAVVHLMVSGRLRRRPQGAAIPSRRGLAAFDFPGQTFLLTEESTKKRASIHLATGRDALADFDRGGIEPLEASLDTFSEAITSEAHTLKRALTDPRLISGIGGAYADEILHQAGLSPLARTNSLGKADLRRLHSATCRVLTEWIDRLRTEAGDGFPEKVTSFRPEMSVHGKAGEPCPVCSAPVQQIRYADTETDYCAACQTGGRIFADRSLSRLLKDDWPRSLEDLER
jgi:formamidopyrimidine-DNA glycosylase